MMPPPAPTTNTPTRKISGTVIGGAVAILATWAIETFAHVTIPTEVGQAFGLLVGTLVGWYVPEAD